MTLAVRNNQVASEQADPAHVQVAANELERAIGSQVRRYRKQFGLTVAELADRATLSSGMLSKIENGNTSPSLATLRALSIALNVPVTALFRQFEEQRDATFVSAGQGLQIERRGTRAGHQYQLLGHSILRGVPDLPAWGSGIHLYARRYCRLPTRGHDLSLVSRRLFVFRCRCAARTRRTGGTTCAIPLDHHQLSA